MYILRNICIVLLLALMAASMAQKISAQTLKHRLGTAAGELKIVQLDKGQLGNQFAITINDKIVLKTNGEDGTSQFSETPVPEILKYVQKEIAPFDEVVVFQQHMWGNACNGGPIWFLGLRKNGSFQVSKHIEFCGGKDPIVKVGVDKITIVIPGGPPNRGSGYIPGETWVYQNGDVRQVKARAKQRK